MNSTTDRRDDTPSAADGPTPAASHDGDRNERRRMQGRTGAPRRGPMTLAQRQMPPRLRKVSQAAQSLASTVELLEEVRSKAAAVDLAVRAATKPSSPMAGVPKDAPPLTAPQSEIAAFVNSRGETSALKSMPPAQKTHYSNFRDGKFAPPSVDNWDALLTDAQHDHPNDNVAKRVDQPTTDDRDNEKDSSPPKTPRVHAGTADLAAMYGVQLTPSHFKAWLRRPNLATPDALATLAALARVRKARARINGRIVAARTYIENEAATAGVDSETHAQQPADASADRSNPDTDPGLPDSNEDEGNGRDVQDPSRVDRNSDDAAAGDGSGATTGRVTKNGPGRMSYREARVLRGAVVQVREARAEIKSKLEAMLVALDSAEENVVARLDALGSKAPAGRRGAQQQQNDGQNRAQGAGPAKPNAVRRGGGPRRMHNAGGARPYSRTPRRSDKQQQSQQPQQSQQGGDTRHGNNNQTDGTASQVEHH